MSIDMDELQQELEKTQTALRKWAAATSRAATECKAVHLRNMRVAAGEVESLNERHRKLERQAAEVQQCMSRDIEERDALKGVAESLVAERGALARRLAQLRSELEADAAAADEADHELQQERGAQASRLGALDRVLAAYRSVLGLELVPGDDELALVFTLVDPRDHARAFRLAVRVLDDNSYEVTACDPPLPNRAEVAELLRHESRFAEGVRAARRGFAAAVQAEVGTG